MKWEYKTAIEANCYALNKKLNKLGVKGWEAYSVVRIDNTLGNVDHLIFEAGLVPKEVYIAYLKRPKS